MERLRSLLPFAGLRRRGATVGALATLGLPAAAQPRQWRFDFEDTAPSAQPAGFTFGLTGEGRPVDWRVLDDPDAPAGPRVLSERSADRTDNRFPLAIVEGIEVADLKMEVDFRAAAGAVDQAAGLAWRLRDPLNYYVARANALENNVRLYRVVRGRRIQFAGADIIVPRNRWQRLGVEMRGTEIAVSLNGAVLFRATDRSFAAPGRVALWTKADSITHFDRLVVASA